MLSLLIIISAASFFVIVKMIRLLFSKIFEIKYEKNLTTGNFLKATLWGRLYYNCLSASDRRREGIKNINATVNKDIHSNFFIQHRRKATHFNTPVKVSIA